MTRNGNWEYVWDNRNRLIKATGPGTVAEYKYDVLSRRIERKVTANGKLTAHEKFLFDGHKMVAKVNLTDNLVQSFVWHEDELLALSDNTGANFSYLKDNYKNVVLLLGGQGEVDSSYAYSPFGRLDRATGSYSRSNPYTFSSEQRDDAVNLVYYHYRYYAPGMGRWISRDPIEENGGVNLFAFCSNTLSHDNYGLLPKDIENVLHLRAPLVIRGGVIGGGGIEVIIEIDMGDHCCKSGPYKNQRRVASDFRIGITASISALCGVQFEIGGFKFDLILTGPTFSVDILHTQYSDDQCDPSTNAINVKNSVDLKPGLENATVGKGVVSVTVSASIVFRFTWDITYYPANTTAYYNVGVYITNTFHIKATMWILEGELRLPDKYLFHNYPLWERSGRL